MTTILLVEDNELNRDMLSRRLERKGYRVVCAADGAESITLAQSAAPQIVLMDMNLPVIDGWEATRRIKASLPELPIIGLTAHAMAGDQEKCLAAGCNAYETKPVDFQRLLGKISDLVGARAG